MITKGNLDTLNLYMASDSIGRSNLVGIMGGMDVFNHQKVPDRYYDEKTHFVIGTAVDTQLTMAKKVFKEIHYVSNIPSTKSASKVLSISKYVYDQLKSSGFDFKTPTELKDHPDLILQGCQMEAFQPSWGTSAKIGNIVDKGSVSRQHLQNH